MLLGFILGEGEQEEREREENELLLCIFYRLHISANIACEMKSTQKFSFRRKAILGYMTPLIQASEQRENNHASRSFSDSGLRRA